MGAARYQSWGRYPRVEQQAHALRWRDDPLPTEVLGEKPFLPFGNGRSYGDVCLNDGGMLLDCRGLNRFMNFDATSGRLQCEAGVTFAEILRLTVSKGWFLPVTPGTKYVTLGGAIANDEHGKNHHRAGTLGRHVIRLELLRSDGTRQECSPQKNHETFAATIGGLGLTGVITWAEIQLAPITGPGIAQEVIRYGKLSEFFALSRESDSDYEYTVAWIDCLATGDSLGRGLFMRGNHGSPANGETPGAPSRRLTFPVDPPFAMVNGLTLRAFNELYYRRQRAERVTSFVHYEPFFYPLDTVHAWNRVYGSKGFFQYQCALPEDGMEASVQELLERIGRAGAGSFLAVLKLFGDKPSPGLLSFPLPGATLTLDFPNKGTSTLRLLDQLDEVTRAAGGRVNPSKDARMHPEDFRRAYPEWASIIPFIDPQISSSFWRRVTEQS